MIDEVKKAKALLRNGDGGKGIDWCELIKKTRSVAKRSSVETDARLRNKKALIGGLTLIFYDSFPIPVRQKTWRQKCTFLHRASGNKFLRSNLSYR